MILRFTPEAIQDLQELKNYIGQTLHNAKAAARITKSILGSCAVLKSFPQSGTMLEVLTSQPSDVRYIVAENHLIFYRVEDGYVMIARILDGRTDYLKILLK